MDDSEAGVAPPPLVVAQPLRRGRPQRRGAGLLVATLLVVGYTATRVVPAASTARLADLMVIVSPLASAAVAPEAVLDWDPACEEASLASCGSDASPALQGVDVVEYFASGARVMGAKQHSAVADGSLYYFSTAANRDLFAADPAAYAPQCGGFCAYGMSGADVDSHATVLCDLALDVVDTTVFKIDDGKLYLFKGASALAYMEDGDGFSANAASAAANFAQLAVADGFVNSNSKTCQSAVSEMWRDVAMSQ